MYIVTYLNCFIFIDCTANRSKSFCLQLTVSLVLKEWQFSDGSVTLSNSLSNEFQCSIDGSPKLQSRTGRKLRVKVVEGRALAVNSKSGKCDPYVKLQYGKVFVTLLNFGFTNKSVYLA